MREALERRRNAPVHHPGSGWTASEGMQPQENPGDTVRVDPREVGRVSSSSATPRPAATGAEGKPERLVIGTTE